MRDYLVKQTHACLWHFTYMQNNGICFTKLNNARKQEYEVLLKQARSDYDMAIDDNNHIHLVCQDDTGSIIYLNYYDNKWHKFVILKSKTPTNYNKNFQLKLINGWLNLFYTIEYRGKKMLTHHILDSSVEPIVLDYVKDDYFAACDYFNNIYLFYSSEIANSFGWRKYKWNSKQWEDFVPMQTGERLKNIQAVVDKDDKIHIVGEDDKNIIYLGNDEKKIIGKGEKPIIFLESNTLWCMYSLNNIVQAISSTNSGANWQSSGDFLSGRGSNPVLFNLAYTSYEGTLHGKSCYGYYNNDIIRLYVLNKFLQVQMEPPPIKEEIPGSQVQEFANLFSDTKEHEINKEMDPEIEITKLKIQVSELCEQISKTDRKLEAVVELINRINNDIKKLETIDENIKLILKSRENEKKNLWSLWGK